MTEPGLFAFVVHPLKIEDFARKFGVLRRAPARPLEWIARFVPPIVASHITGIQSVTGASAEGWFIGLPLTPRVMLESPPEFVYRRLVQCGELAEKKGARILGLGAFTKVVGDGGVTVAQRIRIPVTTGNSYTAATAIEGALLAAERMDIDLHKAHAAVIGATGSIGAVCSQILAPRVGSLALVARNVERLEALASRISTGSSPTAAPKVSTDVRRTVREADVVIAVPATGDALIQPEDLRPGAVVCDVARPRSVSRMVYQHRQDVLVIDGGVIEVPGDVNFGLNFGMPARMCEACMAETMILALEGRYEDYTVGRQITLERVEEISTLARKHGFRIAGFRRFERAISEDEVERIRAAARSGRIAVRS